MNQQNHTHRFHFTLGPVQGFVSQARRTRDFWAGSFILSYLIANAMKSVREQHGVITLPDVTNDALLQWVEGNQSAKEPPTIGTIPNRFSASVPAGFKGNEVAGAVRAAWEKIADAVWNKELAGIATVKQKNLWNEQIKNFWEISWVCVSAEQNNPNLLDRRKNWRSHYPPEQKGDKCTMMGEWQELSGVEAPGEHGQKMFWEKVRKNITNPLELRDNERLCAIAYIKRRFVHVWQAIHKEWKLPTGVPSTSYMAAVHWLEQAIEHAPDDKLKNFHDSANKLVDYGEWSTSIHCIDNKVDARSLKFRFSSLDGRVFFRSELENNKEFDTDKAKKALNALSELSKTEIKPGRKLGYPTPFYAVLLMDGDNLGAAIAAGKANEVGKALEEFTNKVSAVVKKNNGFLVYAGGDDVLALLPLEDALDCAINLREAYIEAFNSQGFNVVGNPKASISGAIIYAHMKIPLTAVLKDSHRLLDDVAKDKTGRDAIAVRVWKPGGIQLTWSMRWDDAGGAVQKLAKLTRQFQQSEDDEPGHASKSLYRIRERLEMLKGGSGFSDDEIKKLLVAEYATSGVLTKEDKKNRIPEARIADLLPLCKKADGSYGAEAAMLLRFLAQKGVER